MGQSIQYEPCSLGLEVKEKLVSTNPTRALNPKVNMAVQFNVACEATGYKITDIRVQILNKTTDCEREPKLCGDGEWDRWSDWGQCTVEGFQIRRRQCKAEPCVGEMLQERKCQPTISEICKGDGDESLEDWAEWSACQCKHELDLPEGSGVRSRIPKCRWECPNVSSCPDTVQYETCICESAVKMQRAPETNEGSKLEVGYVIGAALAGCVLTIFVLGALYYFKCRNKNFDVSKAEETSLHNTSRESKYSTIPRGNGVPNRGPPSTSSSHSTTSKDSINTRRKTSSPLKMLQIFRKHHSSAEAV